jgi:hypothetical protein
VSTRWARITLSTLAVSVLTLAGAASGSGAATRVVNTAPLTLVAQTPFVQASAPWFNLTVGVGERSIAASQLRVNLTFYSGIRDPSQFQQVLSATPDKTPLLHVSDLPVSTSSGARQAGACVTVLPESSMTPPTPAAGSSGSCPANSPTLDLDCTPDVGLCGDVYPVSVTLLRQGTSTPLARFTTFLTYEEPTAVGGTGALRVGLVLPLTGRDIPTLTDDLADHHQAPVTLAVSPRGAATLHRSRSGSRVLGQLADLTSGGNGDQLLSQPYVPIDVASLQAAGLGGEIVAQLDQGDALLRQAGLHPSDGTWVDTASSLSVTQAGALVQGVQAARAHTVVVDDDALGPLSTSAQKYTFAQPFTLEAGHGHLIALAADSTLDSRFTADSGDPVLAANQLLGGLAFIHFENTYLDDPRGIVLHPPASWQPSSAIVTTLLAGLTANPALSPVTLDQLVTQVPAGGNGAPTTRKLAAGLAEGPLMTAAAVAHIALSRQHLTSFAGAIPGHTAALTPLSEELLASEAQGLSGAARSAALGRFDRAFTHLLSAVSLATEHTITFTASTAPIPITVLSTAPYPVHVVLSVQSDKFTFSGGGAVKLTLDRATTPIRVQAHARTSGDRLPVEVTLRTPDGLLVIAHTTLTVHSTSISIVGIALTVLAGLVLLMWWARTWRRSRRRRPRAR